MMTLKWINTLIFRSVASAWGDRQSSYDPYYTKDIESHLMELFPIQQTIVNSNQYSIMVIGGAEDKENQREILKTFFEKSGGDHAIIGIIPCASREPTLIGDRYYQIFTEMGAKQVQVLDLRQPAESHDPRWSTILSNCTGVFITGGDQVRLCWLIGGSQLLETIKTRVKLGKLVLAGTSAGAAMMGAKMISGGSSGESPNRALVDLADGLAILPELVVDQHFHNRNRMARLLSAIANFPDRLGIGIDEDTCAMFAGDGTFQVLGAGTITVIDPGKLSHTNFSETVDTLPLSMHNLTVHILVTGDKYDYRNRVIVTQ